MDCPKTEVSIEKEELHRANYSARGKHLDFIELRKKLLKSTYINK